MTISDHIKQVRERLRCGEYTSEAAVSQGIIIPVLLNLGWPVFDTNIVVPEYSLQGRRVDFALCHPPSKPSVFVEVKKVGLSDGADRQLFEYAFHTGVPMAILTDGLEWSFYLPSEQGRYDERRVYKLDLLERNIDEAVNRLERYLRYERLCSGEVLKSARSDYQNVARNREIEAVLPKAWNALLKDPDSLLLDLFADKAEDLCGYKPDLDLCNRFLTHNLNQGTPVSSERPSSLKRTSQHSPTPKSAHTKSVKRKADKFTFVFEGRTYQAGSAREVMVEVFQLLANADKDFLKRFASRNHGKKRRYIAEEKMELYPGRPDLSEEHSTEIIPGWWIGTNYSRNDIQKILNLALEVAGPGLRSSLKVNVL